MIKTGTTYNSRRDSDRLNKISKRKREGYTKREVASFLITTESYFSTFDINEVIKLIRITGHDRYYREVKYKIEYEE